LPEGKKNIFKRTIEQWGGGTSLFFCYTHLSHDLTTGVLVALLPFVRQEMDLNYFQAGLLVSALAITSGLAQILGGWVGDRIKRRWIALTIGLAGVGLSSAVVGLMPSYTTLLVALIILGLFTGFYHPSAVPALSGLFSDKRGKAIGLHMIGGSIGFGVGPFLGTAIAATLNWHMAFIILSLPALIAGLSVALWLRKIEPSASESANKQTKQSSLKLETGTKPPTLGQVLKPLAGMIILVVFVTFTSGSLLPFVPLFLVDHLNQSNAVAAIWMGVIRAAGILGSILGGWLSDRWGNKQTIMLAIITTGPAMLLFAYLDFHAGLAVIMILIGLLMAMRETAVQTYIMGKTPLNMHGIVFGIYFGIGMQGQSLLQPAYGGIMDGIGISSTFAIVGFISIAISIASIFIAKKL
jgi:MFS transporter, FSR family, fosmidomycin resistance protein